MLFPMGSISKCIDTYKILLTIESFHPKIKNMNVKRIKRNVIMLVTAHVAKTLPVTAVWQN